MTSVAEPEPLATFESLPSALALAVFARLPADARLRCAEVCPSWRVMLRERNLWLRLDLSPASGGLARPATDALLHAAAARAAGGLQSLDVTDCTKITHEALRAVAAANAGALRELRACGDLLSGQVWWRCCARRRSCTCWKFHFLTDFLTRGAFCATIRRSGRSACAA
jgi:hypothetical protein